MTDERDPIEHELREFALPPSAHERHAVLSAFGEPTMRRHDRRGRWAVRVALAAAILLAFQVGRWVEGLEMANDASVDTPIAIDELVWGSVPADGLAAGGVER